jgi:hypothetical protein
MVPPGVGLGWRVLIRGTWTALSAAVGYARPVLTAATPPTLPATGGVVNVTGSNFGWGECVSSLLPSHIQLAVTAAPSPGQTAGARFEPLERTWALSVPLVPTFTPCTIVQWAPEWILCRAPPGLDPRVDVRVVAGGQVATAVGLVGYAPPAVRAVFTEAPPRTCGGTLITVTGEHFPTPPWPVAVRVGTDLCDILEATRSDTSITCATPRGAGAQPVYVHTLLQASIDNASLTYASPTITNVSTPLGRPLEGGFLVDVTGEVGGRSADSPQGNESQTGNESHTLFFLPPPSLLLRLPIPTWSLSELLPIAHHDGDHWGAALRPGHHYRCPGPGQLHVRRAPRPRHGPGCAAGRSGGFWSTRHGPLPIRRPQGHGHLQLPL